VITDTYPDRNDKKRTLMLYHPGENRRVDIGRFLAPPPYEGDIRCDLHPRWSRDGRQVCFDSVHQGTRQMYVADVGGRQ
jgi:Tol biopolymer transport system component